ncbi:MAG: TonB-dependent receptor plug domain-containing protein, partial [Bryobacteraceae bacterium]
VVEPTVERTVDVTLQPGAVTEAVSVTAEAPLIEQTKAQLSRGVDAQTILMLPGLNSLNGLALLQPGVAPNDLGRPGAGFVVNGGRTRSNNFMIDGANNNDQSLQTPRQNLPPEVLGEFRIITNNFSAEFGRNFGSVVMQTTRSGTNEFHGIARWSWLGNGLNALSTNEERTFKAQKAAGKDDYSALRAARSVLVRNQALFSAGGPIRKDRVFFFTSYDFDRRRSTASPTAVTISPQGYQVLDANAACSPPAPWISSRRCTHRPTTRHPAAP